MDSSYFTNPLVFLIEVLFSIYIYVVLLRFLLQLFKADFYNPISQIIVKVTSPVLIPLRRVIPGMGGLDIASLVLAWALKTVELVLVLLIAKGGFHLLLPMFLAIPELIEMTINLFLFAIFVIVILSWVGTGGYNPAISILHSITNPILAPIRRRVKPIASLDLSPMIAMILLILMKMLLPPPFHAIISKLLG